MVLVRVLWVMTLPLAASDFSLTVANPAAVRVAAMKKAALAVRAENCADAKVTAAAASLARGSRITIPLPIVKGEQAGTFAVGYPGTGLGGAWVIVLTGECGAARAGAIVPMTGQGLYDRDRTKLFSHAPSDSEIGAALKEGERK